MDGRQYAGVTHARLRKAAQGAGPSAKWAQCRRWVTVGGRVMAECEPVSDAGGWTKADKFARHIAAANPAAVLAMLARIDQLEAERGDLEQQLAGMTKEAELARQAHKHWMGKGVHDAHRAAVLQGSLKEARNIFVKVVGWSEHCDAVRLIDYVLDHGQYLKREGNQL